ncbi:MAG: glycosyltransferase [Cellulophaga sp.]|nr:glycosyltransferase [Cellulophaga sp.]
MLPTTENNILIVLVLYNEFLENSETFKSLLKGSFQNKPKHKIIVYDNSTATRHDLSFLKKYESYFTIEYVSDDTNPGISHAYNYAFKVASEHHFNWLLLLDQDTKLPVNYIQTFIETVECANTCVVSFVPRVEQEVNELVISPFKINSFGVMKKLSKKVKGVIDYNIIAINSGAFISVAFLSEIGGFSKDYPLDMLDFWLFSKISENKKLIYVLDINVLHDLSVANFENNVSLGRYESILSAEKRFYSSTRKRKYFHKIRLIKRLFQQSRFKNKSFFKKTLKYFLK